MPREPRYSSNSSSMPSTIRGHCMYINPLSIDGQPCGRQLKREEDVARHVLIHVRKEVAYMNAGGRIARPLVRASREQLVDIGVPPQSVTRAQRYIAKEFPAGGTRDTAHSPTTNPESPYGASTYDIDICTAACASYHPAQFSGRNEPCSGEVVPPWPMSIESSSLSVADDVIYSNAMPVMPEPYPFCNPDYGTVPVRLSSNWSQPERGYNEPLPIGYDHVTYNLGRKREAERIRDNTLYLPRTL